MDQALTKLAVGRRGRIASAASSKGALTSVASQTTLFSAALLVFLSTTARTGVIAPDFGPGANGLGLFHRCSRFAHDVAGLLLRSVGVGSIGGCACECARGLVQSLLRHITQETFKR